MVMMAIFFYIKIIISLFCSEWWSARKQFYVSTYKQTAGSEETASDSHLLDFDAPWWHQGDTVHALIVPDDNNCTWMNQ